MSQTEQTTGNQTDHRADSQTGLDTQADTQPDTAVSSAPKTPEEQIAALQAQLKETEARAQADVYNFQKRMERENENARKYALEKFAGSLLDVVDNLERALVAAGEEESPLVEGVRLTQKSLLAALEKHGVLVVDPVDAPFDAEQHQAVGMDPGTPTGQVGKVLQKGYSLNGRLLRPAMVMVGQ